MQFNTVSLLKGPVGTSKLYSLDATFAPLEDTRTDHVRGQVKLTHIQQGVWVSGVLQASAVCSCCRCLQDVMLSVEIQIEEIYFSIMDIAREVTNLLPEDVDTNFTIDANHVLDITEAVRQSTILALPMKPLCAAGCIGICPFCGANKNHDICDCGNHRIDNTWASLEKLFR